MRGRIPKTVQSTCKIGFSDNRVSKMTCKLGEKNYEMNLSIDEYEAKCDDLLDKIRLALSRQISQSVANKEKEILAYEIDDDTMELLEQQTSKEESNVKIDLSKFTKFKKILKETRKDIIENNAILVVPQQYRQIIFILVSQLFMDIPVICFEEVNLDYKLTILGKI